MSATYSEDQGGHNWRCEECGCIGFRLSTRAMAEQEFERHEKEDHPGPLSPAAREAVDFIASTFMQPGEPIRREAGRKLADALAALPCEPEPVVEPVREWGVRHCTDLVSRFDDQEAATIARAICPPGCNLVSRVAGGERETVAREPTPAAEPVSVLPEGDGTGEGLREALRVEAAYRAGYAQMRHDPAVWHEALLHAIPGILAAADTAGPASSEAELDRLRAELTQLRDERDEARAAVKSLGVAYRTLQELCAAMDGLPPVHE